MSPIRCLTAPANLSAPVLSLLWRRIVSCGHSQVENLRHHILARGRGNAIRRGQSTGGQSLGSEHRRREVGGRGPPTGA